MRSHSEMLHHAHPKPPTHAASVARFHHAYAHLFLALLLVCAAVVGAHWPVLSTRALFLDDHQYFGENPLVRNCGWNSVARFLTEVRQPSTVAGYYQPLTMISLMLDCAAGASPRDLRPFHRTNLALHTANTLLVVVLLYQLFGSAWAAASVGLLFGLHPVVVEPLAWVTERKTLLAAFFALASLAVYVANARRPARPRYLACLLLFALALLSKPTSMPLPVLMLLLDWWPLRRLTWRSVGEKTPFLLLAVFSAAITIISQYNAAGLDAPTRGSPQAIALALCHNWALYLTHIVWPLGLSPHYPFPEPLGLSQTLVLGGAISAVTALVLLPISLRWTRSVVAGFLFFVIALLPTSGIVGFTYVIAADKYLYLPILGLLLTAGSAVTWLMARVARPASRLQPVAVTALVLLLALGQTCVTRDYLTQWNGTEQLHRYVLKRTSDAHAVRSNLAAFLLDNDRPDDAIAETQYVVARRPDHWKARATLGAALQAKGRTDEAIAQLEQSIRLNPRQFPPQYNLGLLLFERGRLTEAISCYQAARQLRPDDFRVHINLGNAFLRQGASEAALACYDEALRLKPGYARGHFDRGLALSALGRTEAAATEFRRALQIDPQHAGARRELQALEQSPNSPPNP